MFGTVFVNVNLIEYFYVNLKLMALIYLPYGNSDIDEYRKKRKLAMIIILCGKGEILPKAVNSDLGL